MNQQQLDKLQDGINDAIGRVVARIEMYDDAVADDGADRGVCLQELLKRCRGLKTAVEAHRAFVLSPSAPSTPNQE